MFNAKESYEEWHRSQLHFSLAQWMDMIREKHGKEAENEFWEYFRVEHTKPMKGTLFS